MHAERTQPLGMIGKAYAERRAKIPAVASDPLVGGPEERQCGGAGNEHVHEHGGKVPADLADCPRHGTVGILWLAGSLAHKLPGGTQAQGTRHAADAGVTLALGVDCLQPESTS